MTELRNDPQLPLFFDEVEFDGDQIPETTDKTKNDEWYTPLEWVERFRDFFGGSIGLDPASCSAAQATVNAERYYTKADDALSQTWVSSTAYLNPPYSRGLIDRFIDKAIRSHRRGDVDHMIIMTNASVETGWAQSLLSYWPGIYLLPRGRISFWRVVRKPCGAYVPQVGTNTRAPQMIMYLGDRLGDFEEYFGHYGHVGVYGRLVRHPTRHRRIAEGL